MYSLIQPDSLYVNQAKPVGGLELTQVYDAVNPLGLPGLFRVMPIQISETVSAPGIVLRQEYGYQSDESLEDTDGGATTYITDTTHGISTDFIDDENRGWFYYIDDAVVGTSDVGTPEVGEVRGIRDANTIDLLDATNDAVVTADSYQLWKPGRMKIADDDATIQDWGLSCRSLTDEYYGFMVVKGYWMASTSASTGQALVAGGAFVSDATSGAIQGVVAGTNDSKVLGVSVVDCAADGEYVPVIVNSPFA